MKNIDKKQKQMLPMQNKKKHKSGYLQYNIIKIVLSI